MIPPMTTTEIFEKVETKDAMTLLGARHVGLLLSTIWRCLPDSERQLVIVSHASTYTAHEKQCEISPGLVVQKTISVKIDEKLALVSGLGDFHLTNRQKKEIAQMLGVRKAKGFSINPSTFSAEEVTGIPRGMVSPFLPPGRFTSLEAIFLLQETIKANQDAQVAVSLSLSSSVLVPAANLIATVQDYCLAHVPIPLLLL